MSTSPNLLDELKAFNWLPHVGAAFGLVALLRFYRFFSSDCDLATIAAESSMPKEHAFDTRVVWITGASSGIGKQLAISFVKQGAKVIISSRKREALELVKTDICCCCSSPSETVAIVPMDLEDQNSIQSCVEKAINAFGHVDILVNNAGITTRFLGRQSSFELDSKVMNVDFYGAVCLTRALLPHMISRNQGHIVNISSLSGKFGFPLRTAYCAAKHALLGWMNALRWEEEVQHNIFVTNCCPGFVCTGIDCNALGADGQPTNVEEPDVQKGMKVERCAQLVLAAVYSKIEESWLAKQPTLFGMYMLWYFPAVFRFFFGKRIRSMIPTISS